MSEKQIHDIEAVGHEHEDNGNFDRSWRDEEWNMATGDRKLSVAAQEVAVDEKVDLSMRVRFDTMC